MKFTIEQETLEGILKQINKVVAARPTVPVLSHVLIQVADDVKFTATNLDQMMIISCDDVSDLGAGDILLPLEKLLAITKVEAGMITVEQIGTKQKVKITTDTKSRYELHGLGAADDGFPHIKHNPGKKKYQFPANKVARAMERTLPAVSTDDTRYVLQGIYLHDSPGLLNMIATDGRRIYMDALPCDDGPACSSIIPTKAAELLKSVIPGECDVVLTISQTKNTAAFLWGDYELYTKLTEGTFPAYAQIIPESSEHVIEVQGASLAISLMRAAAVIDDEKLCGIDLVFDKVLKISAKNVSVGVADIQMNMTKGNGTCKVRMNSGYMMNAVKSAASESIKLCLNKPGDAVLLKADDNFRAVIMPLRAS